MGGEPNNIAGPTGPTPAQVLAWAFRGLFGFAALAVVFYLFVLYRPPEPRTYPGREKVVFWHMWTSNWETVVKNICDRFNQSQDRYEVVPLTVIGGTQKTLIATAGGDPPDCMAQWDAVIPAWAERGALTPLDELMGAQEWERLRTRLYPAVRAIGTYKGHFYGLSVGMNIWAIYYRPNYFREAGLDPDHFPTTLEELDAASDKLFQYDAQQRLSRLGLIPKGQVRHWIAAFGGSLYDEQTGQLTFTNQRNIAALEWMKGRIEKYGFQQIQQFNDAQASQFQASWPFINGAYALAVDGQWRVEQIAKYAPELDYRVAPIPAPKGGKALACWSNGNFMLIPTGAKHKAGAWAFIRFWSGLDHPERAAELYTWGGWLPIVPEITAAPAYQEYLKKYPQFRPFVDILASENVQVTPPVPVQAYLASRLDWVEDAALRGALPPRAALEQAEREVRRELENLHGAK